MRRHIMSTMYNNTRSFTIQLRRKRTRELRERTYSCTLRYKLRFNRLAVRGRKLRLRRQKNPEEKKKELIKSCYKKVGTNWKKKNQD